MKKIPTVFVRDRATGYVTDQVTPGCEWVLAGEGVATRKFDGTCVMFDGDRWWARREVKPGKTPPAGWVEVDRDDTTGKRAGWEPIEQSGFVKFWREAVRGAAKFPHEPDPPLDAVDWLPGTYELVGPKINGNPEHLDRHDLERHGQTVLQSSGQIVPGGAERITVTDLLNACRFHGWEGIVWHHRDGRRAKLKVRDYTKAADA